MMKPKAQNQNDNGVLEFFGDIIGTVHYKGSLEKLSEKVEVLSEYRVGKLNRLRIVEKEKASLGEPIQEAVQYLQQENRITRMQRLLYHYKRFQTTKGVTEHMNKLNELDKELLDLANKMKEVHDEKEEKHKIIMERGKKWDNNLQQ